MYKTKIGAKRARGLELVKRIHWKRNEKFKDTPVVTKAITKAKREYKGKQKVDETVALGPLHSWYDKKEIMAELGLKDPNHHLVRSPEKAKP